MSPYGPPRRAPLRILVAAAVTVAVAPFLVIDALGGDDEVAVRGAVEERAGTTSAPGVAAASSSTLPGVAIDPRWSPMGTSSYGEEDDQTQDRIDRWRGLVAAALPPPTTTSVPEGRPGASSTTSSTSSPRRAAPPTEPPPAAAAPTPAPVAPPTTVAPTTTPPAPTAPPPTEPVPAAPATVAP